jgi:PAS domain S-box-containing protein
MNKRPSLSVNIGRYSMLLALLAVVAALSFITPGAYFVLPQRDFLPLHILLEFTSVLVAFMVFGVTWHSLSPARESNITLIGCAMLASGLLDFGHTLSYLGMPDFITPSSPEKGIAFWLAARFTVAVSLCAASFMPTTTLCRPQHRYALLTLFALYTMLVYWIVIFHQSDLPSTFIEGYGLTGFKISCEWAIISLFGIAAFRWRLIGNLPDGLRVYFFSAAIIFILGEMFFIQYKVTTDIFNVIGHLYKIIGFFLLYLAVFVTMIEAPYHEIGQQQIRYRQLFEHMTSCCAVYQAIDNGNDFIFMEVNHAVERTEKIGRDKFIGRRVTELFPNATGLLNVFRRVWGSGQPEEFPANYYQDGHVVGRRDNYVYRLPGGNIVAIYDDITERISAEHALQESEKNFRVIFETAALGMAEADPITGQFLRVNLKFCQMTGYSEEELLSNTFAMITHPGMREQDMEGWRRMVSGEIPEYATEKRYIHKDGHEFWVYVIVVALRDENGKILRTLKAVTDINARKQAESDRHRYDQELKSIFNALPDFYFRLSSDGTILSYRANPTAMGELYVPPEQFIGQRMQDILPPAQAALFNAKLNELRRSGKVITFEYQFAVPRGERYYEAFDQSGR